MKNKLPIITIIILFLIAILYFVNKNNQSVEEDYAFGEVPVDSKISIVSEDVTINDYYFSEEHDGLFIKGENLSNSLLYILSEGKIIDGAFCVYANDEGTEVKTPSYPGYPEIALATGEKYDYFDDADQIILEIADCLNLDENEGVQHTGIFTNRIDFEFIPPSEKYHQF